MTEDTNKIQTESQVHPKKKSFLSYPVTEFYRITVTFRDGFASSKQGK